MYIPGRLYSLRCSAQLGCEGMTGSNVQKDGGRNRTAQLSGSQIMLESSGGGVYLNLKALSGTRALQKQNRLSNLPKLALGGRTGPFEVKNEAAE